MTAKSTSTAKAIKSWLDIVQAVVTIGAVIVGGIWTYNIFIENRQNVPHANLEESITPLLLTDEVRLIQVVLKIHNGGLVKISIPSATIHIEDVLPISGCSGSGECAAKQINDALSVTRRSSDRFIWPPDASRMTEWPRPLSIEPGEDESVDFEFAIPATVSALRVYAFVPNPDGSGASSELRGWHVARLVDFSKSTGADEKR